MDQKLYGKIREQLGEMRVIDAHSHMVSEEAWKGKDEGFLALMDYSIDDMVSAGMHRDAIIWDDIVEASYTLRYDAGFEVGEDTRTEQEKWDIVKKFWPYVKNAGNGRVVQKTLKLFFDCDDLTDETVLTIKPKIAELKQQYTYKTLMQDKFKIDKVFNINVGASPFVFATNSDESLFCQSLYTDLYTALQSRRDIYRIEQISGQDIYDIDTLLKAFDEVLDKAIKAGVVGFKFHLYPYLRPLTFDVEGKDDAAKCLDKLLTMPQRGGEFAGVSAGSFEELKPLHNYLQNRVIKKSIEYRVPIQIHSGTFGGSFGNDLRNSKPTNLYETFQRYPQAKFNLLHSSFPYYNELAEVVRLFSNVYLNMAWTDIISPIAFKRCIKEWMLYLPANKVFAFGADQFDPLVTCADAEQVRDYMAEVITELIEKNYLSEKDAMYIAKRYLHDNVLDYYGML